MNYWILSVLFLPHVFALSLVGQEFVGKCLYYQTTVNPQPFVTQRKNCTSLWESFRDAIAFQPTCHVPRERFTQFVRDSQHAIARDKFVFWEHVYDIVMRYSNRGRRTFSIADTLTGFLGDTKFCGSNSSADGVEQDRNKCPGYDQTPECPWSAEAAFWTEASDFFSKSAYGDIELMLNALSNTPLTNDSYFSRFELPNLKGPNVTSLRVLFALNSALPPRETCSGSSVELVKRTLAKQGVTNVTCEVNPSSLKFQFCSEDPRLPFCSKDCDTSDTWSVHCQVITLCFAIVFCKMIFVIQYH